MGDGYGVRSTEYRSVGRINTADFNIGLAEDHEQVADAGLLEELVAHGEVGVHAGRQDGELAVALGIFADARVEGEAAHDEDIEADLRLPWQLT